MSRIEGRPYDMLLGDIGANSFPTIVFLDSAGDVLTTQPWPFNVANFRKTAAGLNR